MPYSTNNIRAFACLFDDRLMEILKVIEILSWITSSTVLVALKIKYFCKYRPKVLCVYTLDGCKILSQSLDLYLEADKTAKS